MTPEVAEAAAAEWRERVAFPVLVTSSATRLGLDELRNELLARVPVAEPEPEGAGEDEVAEFAVFRPGEVAGRSTSPAARTAAGSSPATPSSA